MLNYIQYKTLASNLSFFRLINVNKTFVIIHSFFPEILMVTKTSNLISQKDFDDITWIFVYKINDTFIFWNISNLIHSLLHRSFEKFGCDWARPASAKAISLNFIISLVTISHQFHKSRTGNFATKIHRLWRLQEGLVEKLYCLNHKCYQHFTFNRIFYGHILWTH